jgi:Thioredoxin like C-terminal domain
VRAAAFDVDPDGQGTVTDQKLYQLILQMDGVDEHAFAIEFLDSGVHAYAFTFG